MSNDNIEIKETISLRKKKDIKKVKIGKKNLDIEDVSAKLPVKEIRVKEAKELTKDIKKKIKDKIRADRLAKKELRAAELKSRVKRLTKAERSIARSQQRLSKILRKKTPERKMTQAEVRRQYGTRLPQGNDGIMLHTPAMFTNQDQRSRTVETNSKILETPNMFGGQGKKLGIRESNRVKKSKMKWF